MAAVAGVGRIESTLSGIGPVSTTARAVKMTTTIESFMVIAAISHVTVYQCAYGVVPAHVDSAHNNNKNKCNFLVHETISKHLIPLRLESEISNVFSNKQLQ